MSDTEAPRKPRWTPEHPHPEPATIHLRPKKGENCLECGRTYEDCVGGDTIEEAFEKRIALNDKVERTVPERIDLAFEVYRNKGGNISTSESERLSEEAHQIYQDKRWREGTKEAVVHIVDSVLRDSSFLTLRDKARNLLELVQSQASLTGQLVAAQALSLAIAANEKDLPPESSGGGNPKLIEAAKALAKDLDGDDRVITIGVDDKHKRLIVYVKKGVRELFMKYDNFGGFKGFPVLVKKMGSVRPC